MKEDLRKDSDNCVSPPDQSTGMRNQKIHLANDHETKSLGQRLAQAWLLTKHQLTSQDKIHRGAPILLLQGDLGAGKTSLVKGIAKAMGIKDPVTSPTFALSQHYEGLLNMHSTALVHIDLYRLETKEAADELFAQEEEEANALEALLAVEWPERLSFYPKNSWQIHLKFSQNNGPNPTREAILNL